MVPFNTLVLWRNGINFLGHADTRALLLQRGICGFFAFGSLLQAVQWLPVAGRGGGGGGGGDERE